MQVTKGILQNDNMKNVLQEESLSESKPLVPAETNLSKTVNKNVWSSGRLGGYGNLFHNGDGRRHLEIFHNGDMLLCMDSTMQYTSIFYCVIPSEQLLTRR